MFNERQLHWVLKGHINDFNAARPQQGIEVRIPTSNVIAKGDPPTDGSIIALPVLGGLHHEYRRSALDIISPSDALSSPYSGC
jgi:putative transposase